MLVHILRHIPPSCRTLQLQLRIAAPTPTDALFNFYSMDWDIIRPVTDKLTDVLLVCVNLHELYAYPKPIFTIAMIEHVTNVFPHLQQCRGER